MGRELKWTLLLAVGIMSTTFHLPANASVLAQFTLYGKTAFGTWTDYAGAFGDPGTSITNTPVTAVVTYDANPADYTIDTSAAGRYVATASGIGASIDPTTPGYISIAETINGRTFNFYDNLEGKITIFYQSISISVNPQAVAYNAASNFAEVGFGSGDPNGPINYQTGLSQSFLLTSIPINFSPADICVGSCGSALIQTWYDSEWVTAQSNDSIAAVPEPSSIVLLAFGLTTAVYLRHRQTHKGVAPAVRLRSR